MKRKTLHPENHSFLKKKPIEKKTKIFKNNVQQFEYCQYLDNKVKHRLKTNLDTLCKFVFDGFVSYFRTEIEIGTETKIVIAINILRARCDTLCLGQFKHSTNECKLKKKNKRKKDKNQIKRKMRKKKLKPNYCCNQLGENVNIHPSGHINGCIVI